MPKEELRSRLRLSPRVFNAAVKRWLEAGELTVTAAGVGLPGHEVKLSPAQQARAEAFLRDLEAEPFAPKSDERPDEELLAYLVEKGQVVVLGDVAFSTAAYREMVTARRRAPAGARQGDAGGGARHVRHQPEVRRRRCWSISTRRR